MSAGCFNHPQTGNSCFAVNNPADRAGLSLVRGARIPALPDLQPRGILSPDVSALPQRPRRNHLGHASQKLRRQTPLATSCPIQDWAPMQQVFHGPESPNRNGPLVAHEAVVQGRGEIRTRHQCKQHQHLIRWQLWHVRLIDQRGLVTQRTWLSISKICAGQRYSRCPDKVFS